MRYVEHRAKMSSDDTKGWVLLWLVMSLSVALGAAAFWAHHKPDRDPQSGCRAHASSERQYAVVVDRSDRLSSGTSVLLREAMHRVARGVGLDDRLTLIPFDGKAGAPVVAAFDRCRGPSKRESSLLYENVEAVEASFVARYQMPLEETIQSLAGAYEAPETALVSFLGQALAELTYRGQGKQLVLHVFSNFAEHTHGVSLIAKRPTDTHTFREHVRQHLSGRVTHVEIVFHVVPTQATPPGVAKRIKDAWAGALEPLGARVTWESL